MYIFLDESGDLGFDFSYKTPSSFFIITLLVCDDRLIVKKINNAVKWTLERINFKKSKTRIVQELKGSHTTLAVKKYFYNQISKVMGWHLYSVMLDKIALAKTFERPININKIYNLIAHDLLEQIDFSSVQKVNLLVDKCKDGKGIQDFDSYLKVNLELVLPINSQLMINHEPSQESKGIQAVDMFCYGIFRKYEVNDLAWYSIFKDQISLERKYKL